MASEYLTVDVDDGVGRIGMDRPERYNAMNESMAADLASALDEAAADDAVRCLLLTGTEGAFNTGADLSTFEGDETDADRLNGIATPLHEAVRTLTEAPKPVVTGVNGVVAGGGLGLAIAGDVVILSDAARFEYAYPKLGLSGDGGATWLLPRLVGLRRAQRFALLDEPVDAATAVEWGLATESVPADEFEERLETVATDLATGPTLAYAEIRTLLSEGYDRDLVAHLDVEKDVLTGLTETDDYSAGLRGFLEKEQPTFDGR